jgi:hypothetical protein
LSLAFRRGDEFGTIVDFDVSLSSHTVSSEIHSLVTGGSVLPFTTTLVDAAAGRVNIALTEMQTASLPAGTYGWRLEWVAPGEVKRTALSGFVEVVA